MISVMTLFVILFFLRMTHQCFNKFIIKTLWIKPILLIMIKPKSNKWAKKWFICITTNKTVVMQISKIPFSYALIMILSDKHWLPNFLAN